jgi:5-formyltetrahydrofolate cyclo-ligase
VTKDEPHSHALAPEEFVRAKVKAELRKRMRGLRNAAPLEACRARSAQIALRLEAMQPLAGARAVALFWPMEERHEVDLRPFDATLRGRGVRIAYPAVDPETRAMAFRFVDGPDATALMVERGLGFAEPPENAPVAAPGELDAIVVPALAVDPRGHRIGYGAGFYDRALPAFLAPPPQAAAPAAPRAALTIGVAYDYQLVAEVPEHPHDVPLAWIVTDARILPAAP